MADHFARFHDLLKQGQAVRDSGGKLGADFDRLEQTYRAVTAPQENPGQRLARAIVEGADPAELDRAWLGVLLEQVAGAPARMGASQALMRYLAPALQAELTRHAPENYATARKAYNKVAAEFARAVQSVDPDIAAEALIDDSPDLLKTWSTIPRQAAEVETAFDALTKAAEVAGIGATPEHTIALAFTVPAGVKRRAVWEAWENHVGQGRGGRWAALVRLGVELGAPPLDQHAPYRKPMPVEVEYHRDGIGWGPVTIDPEDAIEAAEGSPEAPVEPGEADVIPRPQRMAIRIR